MEKLQIPKLMKLGVSQSTVLGPVLFTVSMNNLFQLEITGVIISFARDTSIHYKERIVVLIEVKPNILIFRPISFALFKLSLSNIL